MTIPRAWTLLLAAAPACSLSTFDNQPCTTNVECRDAFGLGSVCGGEGLCEVTEVPERCTNSLPEDLTFPVDPSETFLFATLFDHSLDTHVARYRSAELAVAQVNDSDGLNGQPFAILHCDNQEAHPSDGLDKDTATVALATWLADEVGVPAIVGPAASSRTEAAFNAIEPLGTTLMISPSATSPTLTVLDQLVASDETPGLLWRTAPPDSLQGRAIADYMIDTGVARVSVIYQSGAYGDGLSEVFADNFTGDVDLYPFDSETARSEAVTDVGLSNPSQVLFISSDISDVVAFLNSAAGQESYRSVPIFLTDAARTADVLAQASGASVLFPNIHGSAPSLPSGAVYESFQSNYRGRYGGEDVSQYSYTAHAFDAAWLVIDGHAWSWFNEGEAVSGIGIARGLRRISSGESFAVRPGSWTSIVAHFEIGDGVDLDGASGPLDYDAVTEETSAPVDYWIINGAGDDFEVSETWYP
ncbi:MAG: ABC transporter substrate-binding protein [Alphaproteobacteria bacterium]|nr:ABC transporter substrate-binding protein [Alphaproteobacteria bacterium]